MQIFDASAGSRKCSVATDGWARESRGCKKADKESAMKKASWFTRQIARCLLLWMVVPFSTNGEARAQQPSSSASQGAAGQSTQSQTDLEGGSSSKTAQPIPDAPEAQSPNQGIAPDGTQPASVGDQQPLGVAAAPYTRPTGVAGSRPAGAVIAPARQRRVRTILISIGVVVAAGVAIGTVAGLSHASPSHAN